MPWAPLPAGQDIPVGPADAVAAIVSVGKSVSADQIRRALASHCEGLVLDDYAEQGQRLHLGPDPDTDRKYIVVRAHSTTYAGSLSWSKSIFIVAPNLYTIVEAWKLPAGSPEAEAPPPTPPGATPQTSSLRGPMWVGAIALLGGIAYSAWAHRAHLERLRQRLLGR